MRKRTQAREFALQILYQIDITHDAYDISLDNFWKTNTEQEVSEDVKAFAGELVKGVVDNLTAIDDKIASYATNWEIERMAVVDRNILRMSCYELLFREDIPPKVSINEAVDLAKKFSDIKAGKFVNGILDKVKLEKGR
jgi:N utilization substance protein B